MKISLWCGLAMMGVVGCSKGGGASSTGGTVKATCEDSGRRYGEFTAKMIIADAKNPVPADKRKLLAEPIRDATVKACQEDKWDELPLGCLASVFENQPKDEATLDKYTDVCIKSVGKEKLEKLNQRVARAMADAVGIPSGSAAPAASDSTASGAPPSGTPTAASGPAATSAPAANPPSTPTPGSKGGQPNPPAKPPASKMPSQDAYE